jgi:hypothetical protein
MKWYDDIVSCADTSGTLKGFYSGSTVTIKLTIEDNTITIYQKTFQPMVHESPSTEELLHKFAPKIARIERLLKTLTKDQIAKKKWSTF